METMNGADKLAPAKFKLTDIWGIKEPEKYPQKSFKIHHFDIKLYFADKTPEYHVQC